MWNSSGVATFNQAQVHGALLFRCFFYIFVCADNDAAKGVEGQNLPICRLWSAITRLCLLEMLCFCFPVCTAHRQTNQTCQHGTLPKSAALMCPSGEKTLGKKNGFASFAKPSSWSVRFLFLLLNCHFPQEAEALSSFVSAISDNSRISPDLDEPEMHGSV